MSSSSGSTQFPAGPKAPGQTIPADSPREPNAKINTLPAALNNLASRQRVAGDIIAINRDNTIRVRTPQGDIEIQTQAPDVRNLQTGDRVEIEISAGKPPQTARVSAQNEAPSAPYARPSRTPEIRPTATPVNVQIKTSETPAPAEPAPAQSGPIVRTQPVTPEQVLEYLARPPEQPLPATIPETFWQVAATVEIVNLETARLAAEEILTLVSPSVPAIPDTFTQAPILETLAQAPLNPTPPQPTAQPSAENTAQLLPTLPRLIPGAPQNIVLENIVPELRSPLQSAPPVVTLTPPSAKIPIGGTPAILNLPEPPATTFTGFKNPLLTPALLAPGSLDKLFTSPLSTRIPQSNIPAVQIQNITAAPNPIFGIPGTSEELALDFTLPLVPGNPVTLPGGKIQMQTPLILGHQKAGETAAHIIAQTPQKLPIAAFFAPALRDLQFMIMHMPADTAPIGSTISLMPQLLATGTMPSAQSYAISSLPLPAPLYFLTPEPWPMMQEIAALLAATAPRAAHGLAGMTPSPSNPAQLGAAALFFIAAVRGGDLTQWLGDKALDAIRKAGRGGLSTRIGQEGANLGRLASEPVSQDWRGLSLPLQHNGEYHKIALYYKHDDSNQDSDQKGGRQTRFIFDLTLDNMGPVQLDGLFRGSRLDLIVRTKTHFSQAMQMEMRKLYAGALADTKITGELAFQNQIEQWVKINPTNNKLAVAI